MSFIEIATRARTLDQLASGEGAEIVAVQAEDELSRRLASLGLCTGKQVQLLRRASLGGPLHIRAGTTELMLRIPEAQRISVRVADTAIVTAPVTAPVKATITATDIQ